MPWDFNDERKAKKAQAWIRDHKPLWLIGSPMCAAFSQMQNINFSRMNPHDVKRVIEYGTRHLECCIELYNMQTRHGMLFLHDHPASAKSWANAGIEKLMSRPGVHTVQWDLCQFGMTTREGDIDGQVRNALNL